MRLTKEKSLQHFKEIRNKYPEYTFSTEELIYEKLGKLEDIEEELDCPLEIILWLFKNNSIFVLNPIDKTIQEIKKPMRYFDYSKLAFDIRHNNFESTYNARLWDTGGAFFYLKDYKKTWWLKEDKSE